nr:unnamed protein product [Callosobruchus analis]CAI5826968.1 unnamed protein product [Callosobruchus analis]
MSIGDEGRGITLL